ncbi:hypothetical protein LX15_000341 [Streptoalloteichus tenebrarius]|uniref:Uncharacterized protein n=2 Tax=Streptoalloteichus tenebrarius (strain ATCC 17920 / DSM 40477 / JCM 4838 / CBS 697.72 / NBRC 16177 / NCIMB 11028 / NRRL B-12390 / A12253. 1 / ISP 5477) TaxID=1933 RepID=A0ABT1HMC2_STRSD|nr:hypothetical protein [Streptoalloteichus tenebrarius]
MRHPTKILRKLWKILRRKPSTVDPRILMPNLRILHHPTPGEAAEWEASMAPLRRRRVRVVLPVPPRALLAYELRQRELRQDNVSQRKRGQSRRSWWRRGR